MSRVWILKPREGIAINLDRLLEGIGWVSICREGTATGREGIRANLKDIANSLEGAANSTHGAFQCPEDSFGINLYATGSMRHAFETSDSAFATTLKTNMVAGSLNTLERSAEIKSLKTCSLGF